MQGNRGQVDLGEAASRTSLVVVTVLNRGHVSLGTLVRANVVLAEANVEGVAHGEVTEVDVLAVLVLAHTESVQEGSDRKEGFGGKISKCGQKISYS